MKSIAKQLKANKRIIFSIVFIIIISFSFLFLFIEETNAAPSDEQIKKNMLAAGYSQADIDNMFAGIIEKAKNKLFLGLAWIVYGIVWAVGLLFVFMANQLDTIMKFNGFIDVPTVKFGWIIVRDLCNMFFILILLVIAFATILRRESYSAKRLLGKLLIMAVLINFSRMICGLIIDLAQIIMLTFVSGVNNGGASLINLLGFDKFLNMTEQAQTNPSIRIDSLSMFGALLAGLAAAIVALVVIIVLFVVLLFRIVMLWVYIILSPIAFLAAAFPAGAKYSAQWWSEFTKQVIVGPMLAFFYWLAMATVDKSITSIQANLPVDNNFVSNIPADFWIISSFQTYAITLALLVGGLIVTQRAGGMAGSIAGKGLAAAKGIGYRYSGARRVRERWGAFQARREGARKIKVAESGDKWFSRYRTAIKGPGAALQGVREQVTPKYGWKSVFRDKGKAKVAFEERQQKRVNKQEAKENLYKAYENMQESGKSEKVYGDLTYKRNKRGGVTAYDRKGDRVTGQSFMEGRAKMKQTMSPARQVIDESTAAKIKKRMGELSNLSTAELRRVNESGTSNKRDKLASSIMLATKEGFKTREKFQSAKANFGSLPSLRKEFNEIADRRYGLWNNSADMFKDKVSDNTINLGNLATETLESELEKGKLGIDVVADISGIDYGDNIDRMMRTTGDRVNVSKALKKRIMGDKEKGIKGLDFEEEDLPHRRAYARASRDAATAMYDYNKNELNTEHLSELFASAKPLHLTKLDDRLFNQEEYKKVVGDDLAHTYDQFMSSVTDGIKVSSIDSARRTGRATGKLLTRLTEAAAKDSAKRAEIAKYKELEELLVKKK